MTGEEAWKKGWNDRVCGRPFRWCRSNSGEILANSQSLLADLGWPPEAREAYVEGWTLAERKIRSLELP